MTYRRKSDYNQGAIVAELRAAGYAVYDYHAAGHGVPDLIICRGGRCEWVEVKASYRSNLTDAERDFFEHCPGGPPILGWTAALIMAEFERRGCSS